MTALSKRRHGASARRRARNSRGAAAVEFALVVIPLLMLVLGAIEYGWYFYASQGASSAARETARRLSVGDCTGGSQATNFAESQANGLDLSVAFGAPDTATPADPTAVSSPGTLPAVDDTLRVVVTVTNAHLITFLPLPSGDLKKVVNAQVEDDVPSGSC